MRIYVGRHALSEGNNRENIGTLLYGHPNAPLMELGRGQSRDMGSEFLNKYDIDPVSTPVAVSNMLRSQETAQYAGFTQLTQYKELDEVDTNLWQQYTEEKRHTIIALNAAKLILENPPKEAVWISHGLVIASLCEMLGVANEFANFIPKFCEIRELHLPD